MHLVGQAHLVLLVPKVCHALGFLNPRVPYNCVRKIGFVDGNGFSCLLVNNLQCRIGTSLSKTSVRQGNTRLDQTVIQHYFAMLCYAMLHHAMLCYAMLCYAILCCDVLHTSVLCYVITWCAMLRCAVSCMPACQYYNMQGIHGH